MNRFRVIFQRGPQLKYISHLDLIRLWHRAMRRARVGLAYTLGFNPHPRLTLAAPLQLGATGLGELMDVWLDKPVVPGQFTARLERQLPDGLRIIRVAGVAPGLPALQAQVRYSDYRVTVETRDEVALRKSISSTLASSSIPWRHQRDTGFKAYDIRPLIKTIELESVSHGVATLDMRLRSDASGTGRPEQVVKALGMDIPVDICRTGLVLGSAL